jgi:thioredoxin-like negative regulator of GroEL
MPSISTILYNDFIHPKRRMILYVFLVAVFSAATYYAYVSLAKPRMAFYENFGADVANDNTRPGEATLMGFFADWCPHCNNAKPDWSTYTSGISSAQYGKYKLKPQTVDCSDGNDPRIQQYSINGYPTVIIIKDKEVVRFEGKITKDNLDKFVTSTLGKPAPR